MNLAMDFLIHPVHSVAVQERKLDPDKNYPFQFVLLYLLKKLKQKMITTVSSKKGLKRPIFCLLSTYNKNFQKMKMVAVKYS